MKKHITIIALALISLATVFSGCKKNDPKPEPEPETKEKYVVRYEVNNARTFHGGDGNDYTFTLSSFFKVDHVTYTDADGKTIDVKDVTLPWSKEITVESPFDASVGAELTYNEADLPFDPNDTTQKVTVVKYARIGVKKVGENEFNFHEDEPILFYEVFCGTANTLSWKRFLKHVNENPNYLKFTSKGTVK